MERAHDSKMEYHSQHSTVTIAFAIFLFAQSSLVSGDANGGASCATCTVIVALAEQTSVIHNESIIHALDRICGYLPGTYQKACKEFVDFFGPILIDILMEDDTPDTVCNKLSFCFTQSGKPECSLFPKKAYGFKSRKIHSTRDLVVNMEKDKAYFKNPMKIGIKICDLPGIKEICDWIKVVFDNHDPGVDLDSDRFSPYETLRGFSWRGKDCDDANGKVHPGAKPIDSDMDVDSNCNGIKGKDPITGDTYEDLLCSGTEPRGIALLGDSIGAHFHLPREWFNSSELSVEAFELLPFILENEFDWPELSSTTGFMNATDSMQHVIHGPTDSLYYRLWQRNHCNFRDFQNMGVNGARSGSMAETIENSLFRNSSMDYPLIVFYALVGNDVCNGHPDTFADMTTPEEMRKNVLATLDFLDGHLPANSYVMLVGLADGRLLYEGLSNRTHPVGSLRNDVTYAEFYDYFNCLEISPCTGWMNTNSTVREMTTLRAEELSAVLKDVADKNKNTYKNFELYYSDNPVYQALDQWKKQGGELWQLLEPVDGFHTNQQANALLAAVTWKNLEQLYPNFIGNVNPNNDKITQIFGDQGGYL